MGQKDIAEKILEACSDVFADIVNVLVFHGEPRVRPEALEDQPGRSAYKIDGRYREQERDTAKRWMNGSIRIASIGIENQTKSDADMPIRILAYDAAEYRGQLNHPRQRNIYPVVSLVLYFGYEQPWNAALSLHEMLEIPEGMDELVNDYRINLYQIAFLPRETIDRFQSDFRIVADYFWQKRVRKDYIPTRIAMKHVQETLGMLSVMTGDHRFEEAVNEGEEEGEVPKTMCDVLDRIENRGIARGKREGLAEAVSNLMQSMELSPDAAMDALRIPREDRETLMTMIWSYPSCTI